MEANDLREFGKSLKADIHELIDEKIKGIAGVLKADIGFLKEKLASLSNDHDMIIQTHSTVDILNTREGQHNFELKSNIKALGETVKNAVQEMDKTVMDTITPIKKDVESLKTDVQVLKTEKGVKGGIFRDGLTVTSLLIAIGAFIKSIWKP